MKTTIVAVFTSWRMAVVLLMGFVSGIPLALTAGTLQAWMTDRQVDLTIIGIFSLVGMPYALKFLWAPFMDRYTPPFLGRRRGWMLITQLALIISICALGFSDPVASPWRVATLAFLVAFFSASQDIVVDAYRTEVLTPTEYGAGSGIYIMGYRLAMLLSGAVALMMADHMPWSRVYVIMSSTMLLGIVLSLVAPEPKIEGKPPRTLGDAVVLPLLEFFKRKGAVETLAFLLLYKLDVMLTLAMTTPFMMALGFSKTEIGAVTKGFGMIASIVGALFGGALMVKLGIRKALWFFGISQALSGLSYMVLARLGHNYAMMVTAITVENVFSGMGTAAFSAFMMSLCDKRFTATQYALITSFMALSRYMAGTPSGWMAKVFGWEAYFLICAVISIPGLLLLTRYKRWSLPSN